MNDAWRTFTPSPRVRSFPEGKARNMAGREEPLLSAMPLIDMVELPDGVCVYCNLPGANPDGVSLTIDGKCLYIRAVSRFSPLRGRIHALEFNDVVYEGRILLPPVDEKRIEATLAEGVLRVFMPFPRKTKPVRIPVSRG